MSRAVVAGALASLDSLTIADDDMIEPERRLDCAIFARLRDGQDESMFG